MARLQIPASTPLDGISDGMENMSFCSFVKRKSGSHLSHLRYPRTIEKLLQFQFFPIGVFLPINVKTPSWAEKCTQLEKNMFPVGKIFLPNWKPCFWGLLAFTIFIHCFYVLILQQCRKKIK